MNDKIGTGWSFPPHFDKADGSVTMTTSDADIQGALAIIFTTRLEERLFRPDFGCSLEDWQFKSIDAASENRMRRMIGQVVRTYEPRIDLRDIEIDGAGSPEGELKVVLKYSIKEEFSSSDEIYTFQYVNSI